MEGETSNLFTLSSAARWKLMEIAPIYWFAHPQKAKHTGQVINSSGAPAVSNSSLRLKVAASSVSAASDRKKLKQVLPPLTVTLIGLCCMSHALRCLLRNHVLLLHFLILFTIFAHARHTPSFAETMSEQEPIYSKDNCISAQTGRGSHELSTWRVGVPTPRANIGGIAIATHPIPFRVPFLRIDNLLQCRY